MPELPFRKTRGQEVKPTKIDFKVEPGRQIDFDEKTTRKVDSDLTKQIAKMKVGREKMKNEEQKQNKLDMEEWKKGLSEEAIAALEDQFDFFAAEDVKTPTATAKKPEDKNKGTATADIPFK